MRQMISYTNGYCHRCKHSFVLMDTEMPIVPNRDFQVAPPKKICDILTWDDWINHVMTHCRECRIGQPPPSCVEDYNQKMMGKRRQYNKAFDEEDNSRQRAIINKYVKNKL